MGSGGGLIFLTACFYWLVGHGDQVRGSNNFSVTALFPIQSITFMPPHNTTVCINKYTVPLPVTLAFFSWLIWHLTLVKNVLRGTFMSDDNFQTNLVRILDPDPDPIGVTLRLFLYVVWVCKLLRGKARNSGKKKKRKKKKR